MKKLLFATDLHLNHINVAGVQHFINQVMNQDPDCVLITGDISEAQELITHLSYLEDGIKCPVYFVLGNHDYYGGSIVQIRESMKIGYGQDAPPGIQYLSCLNEPVKLNQTTALIGHDGWFDGRYADWFHPRTVQMIDYAVIEELKGPSFHKEFLYGKINGLAKEACNHIQGQAKKACDLGYKHVIIGTHIPPFPQNSVYDPKGPGTGKPSNDVWLPCFSSEWMGRTLLGLSEDYPEVKFTVFCGHSHGDATYSPTSNLTCITGYAKYGKPWDSIKVFDI